EARILKFHGGRSYVALGGSRSQGQALIVTLPWRRHPVGRSGVGYAADAFMKSSRVFRTLAAIDVGTNAVRMEIALATPDGSIEAVHDERDPIRPGEGLFATGNMPKHV